MSNDLKKLEQALDALDPSALSYSEWCMVGMALKEGGYSCGMWDAWSRRDSRYHKGECESKWASFRGNASPVTIASIFDLAYQHGYSGGGRGLDWEDTIDDEAIVHPGWVESAEVVIPDAWDPADQLIRYLQALFEPTEIVGYVTESFVKDEKRLPTRGRFNQTAGEIIEGLSRCGGDLGAVLGDYDPGVGAWIRFNPLDGLGCANANVVEHRFALVESDELELGKQIAIMRELELPIAALVYSGGKSVHAIVRIEAPDYAEYRRRVEYLYGVCKKNGLQPDIQNKNPSRLSRMPGVLRCGKKQYLLETNIGKSSWDEWKDFIEEAVDDLPDTESIADVWETLPQLSEPLIDGVLRQGHKMLLAGPSKAGKSFALIELCIAIAEGQKWLGRFACAQGRVLYINLELDRASCLHRFKDVYEALELQPLALRNLDIWNLRGASCPMDKLAPKLIRRATKKGYIAIVLDPIYKVITGDENSADQMAKFCNQFDRVCRELGCAVIYCHHHSKGSQGSKKSMDRASGSGVFARDPDAMLDLIELEVPTALQEHEADRAECRVRMAALEEADMDDEVSQDEALSPAALRQFCEKLPSKKAAVLETKVAAARTASAARTAWRIEGTLREFARFAPVDLWFDYPVHRADTVGVLGDIQPEADTPGWKKAAAKHTKGNTGRKKDRQKNVESAFEAVTSLGDKPTTFNMAEYMGVAERTARRSIQEHGGYWIDGCNVGKK